MIVIYFKFNINCAMIVLPASNSRHHKSIRHCPLRFSDCIAIESKTRLNSCIPHDVQLFLHYMYSARSRRRRNYNHLHPQKTSDYNYFAYKSHLDNKFHFKNAKFQNQIVTFCIFAIIILIYTFAMTAAIVTATFLVTPALRTIATIAKTPAAKAYA